MTQRKTSQTENYIDGKIKTRELKNKIKYAVENQKRREFITCDEQIIIIIKITNKKNNDKFLN